MAQANWRTVEDTDNVSLRLRTTQKRLGESLAQERRTWVASIQDGVDSVGYASLNRPGRMPPQADVTKVCGALKSFP